MTVTWILAAGMALAPAKYLQPWTGEVGEVAWIPFVPLGMAFGQVRSVLRPPIPELDLQSPLAQKLVQERNTYRGLYQGARIEVERLVRQLQEVSRARQAAGSAGLSLVPATVIGIDGERRNPLLRIGQGSAAGIEPGDVVVFGGDALVGRVVAPVGRGGCAVLPVWSQGSRRIDARARDAVGGVDLPLQVHVGSDGVMRAQAPSGIELPAGTDVLLADREWPREAQGLVIGSVSRIEQPDESPVQRMHVLTPATPVQGLDVVVVRFPSARTAP